MKKTAVGSVVFAALFFSVLSALCAAEGGREILDKVVAVVNDEIITQSELDQLLGPVYEQFRKAYSGSDFSRKMEEARYGLLMQLIEDRLVYQEAKRLGIEVTEEEINERLESFKEKFKKDDFERLLREQGLSVSKLKDRYKEQISIRKLHQMQVRGKVIVTPLEVEDYYKQHVNEFTEDEKIRVRTITIRKNEDAIGGKNEDPEARRKADEILGKIYNGESFEELAKTVSEDTKAQDGGDLGFIARGELLPSIDEVIFNLRIGDVSPVLTTDMGYHIFKVVERQEKKERSFDEAEKAIHEGLMRKKSQERFKEWMEELKKNAYISLR